ncbi:hypothetical protein C5O22_02650 [Treponema sp. J25]|nr:hypothetical protein C5O22_02650 [Treponema sp. J25]
MTGNKPNRQGETVGIVERKQREKDERRRLIFEKTKELILERGLSGFSMQDVADATELSKATLYLYFQNKEAILKEILEDAVNRFEDYVRSRITPTMTGIEALHTLWRSYIEIFGKFQEVFIFTGIKSLIDPVFPFFFHDQETDTNEFPHYRLCALLTAILERGYQDGTLQKTVEPERIAKSVFLIGSSLIEYVARLPRIKRDNKLIIQEMKTIFELILRGLAAPNTDPQVLSLETSVVEQLA